MSLSHSFRRCAAATGGASLIILATASVASAHVTVDPSTTAAGSYSVLTFSVPHGCDGSATTEVTLQIPEQIVTVTPTVNPNWTIKKVMQQLDTPVDDGHGGQYTERVAEVVYTARTPLPDGYRDTMALSLKLPDASGSTLVFPTIQTCEKGETAWTQTVAEGQPEPEAPAPAITLTAAEVGDDLAMVQTASDVSPTSAEAAEGLSSSSSTVTWIALILGALGLVAGGIALVRTRAHS